MPIGEDKECWSSKKGESLWSTWKGTFWSEHSNVDKYLACEDIEKVSGKEQEDWENKERWGLVEWFCVYVFVCVCACLCMHVCVCAGVHKRDDSCMHRMVHAFWNLKKTKKIKLKNLGFKANSATN